MRRLFERWRRVLRTIRARLIIGLALLVGGVMTGVLMGVTALRLMTRDFNARVTDLQAATTTNSLLQGGILNDIATAEAYLASPSADLSQRFHRTGLETHELRQGYRRLTSLSSDERVLIDSIGRLQADLEVSYALAHALLDLGRDEEARAMAVRAREPASAVTDAINALGEAQAVAAAAATDALTATAKKRQIVLLVLLVISTLIGVGLAVVIVRAVESPLAKLVRAAERLGEGDLRPVEPGQMATEFQVLGDAFAKTGERLSGIVKEVVEESEKIASSAGDLSAISEQLAASSGEISTSMLDISSGAEQQAARLSEAGAASEELRAAASENAASAASVAALGEQIRAVAERHREDVQGAITALLEVRNVVRTSAGEVQSLARVSESVDEFVSLVKRIASQTNLLALNAAIEAARAGEHGRGFAVVAEEVRKLADESAAAAEQVTETLQQLREQVGQASRTMEAGVAKVQGVEAVSQGAAKGLDEIVAAVKGVEESARRVAESAATNQAAAESIEGVASTVSGQASKHAAAAESVTAAAEEQSASTEQMAAAAGEMLAAAERLRQVVSGFRL
jgi:methyl-accepting chemotaxis protein